MRLSAPEESPVGSVKGEIIKQPRRGDLFAKYRTGLISYLQAFLSPVFDYTK